MRSKRKGFTLVMGFLLLSTTFRIGALAETGLTVNVAEIGIGKFHRMDNSIHHYENNHTWKPYVLSSRAGINTPQTVANRDRTYTIFFSNLDELMGAMEQLSLTRHMKIKNFNVNTHGLPGSLWFPKDAETQQDEECSDWRESASSEDQANYDDYYTPTSKKEVFEMRIFANLPANKSSYPCTTGLREWNEVIAKHPRIRTLFTSDAQIHFLSCLVGLGTLGNAFTKGIAALLLTGEQGRVQTSMMYGLGDWSLPEGMGFWDYQNDAQLKRDNELYPIDRSDREQMQKGNMRIAGIVNGTVVSSVMKNRDFMFSDGRDPGVLSPSEVEPDSQELRDEKMPDSIRIPGTRVRVKIK